MSKIIDKTIEEELADSYLTYSLSALIRALPSVEDGLTPVKRRSLYVAMCKMPKDKLIKCAKVTGAILAYHAHGDSSVYNHLVLNARPDKTNYPLYISQGNFGNISGDKQAAYRYTEIKISPIARDIFFNRDMTNADTKGAFEVTDTIEISEVNRLHSVLPAILVNGIDGIAVGFATNIPSHDLRAVIDTTIKYIKKPTIRDNTLSKSLGMFDIKDKRYKGYVANSDKVTLGHNTGKSGGISVYPDFHWEKSSHGSVSLVLTSVPYKRYIDNYLESIRKIVKVKTTKDPKHPYSAIRDLVDESAGDIRIRIVISTRHDGITPVDVFNLLLRTGVLNGRETYLNTFVVEQNIPVRLPLKGIIGGWLKYRRRTLISYYKLKNRSNNKLAANYRGIMTVLPSIKKAIGIILNSKTETECINKLMKTYSGLTTVQCKYIIGINLKSYINKGLNIANKLIELEKEISINESYISNRDALDGLIIRELKQIRSKYTLDNEERNILSTDVLLEQKRQKVKLHLTKFKNMCKENSFTKMLVLLTKMELDML